MQELFKRAFCVLFWLVSLVASGTDRIDISTVLSKCTIQRDIINFQHFLTSFDIFQSFTYLFRELNDREIENHYKMNSEKVETWHGIIILPHSMCKIIERVTEKTGRTSCTNWKISFGV